MTRGPECQPKSKMVFGGSLTVISILVWSVSSEYQDIPSMCCAAADGSNYIINTTFITNDCKSKCVCTHDGYIGCVPFCHNSITKCPIGYKLEEIMEIAGDVDSSKAFLSPAVKDKMCFCIRRRCKRINIKGRVTKITDYCIEGNKYYKPGEEFTRDCNKLCRCYKNGKTRCVPLCPDKQPCPPGTAEKEVQIPVDYNHDQCKCKAKACKPLPVTDTCSVNGHSYKAGEDFISADCSASCKCHPGGDVFCTGICPPEVISCQHDEETIKLQRKVPNSNCTCPVWRCLKRQEDTMTLTTPTDTCIVGERNYQAGEDFVSPDCSEYCKCYPGGSVVCASLCQPKKVNCHPNEEATQFSRPIHNSNCTCPTWRCEKKENPDKCVVGKHIYKPGDDFVSPDCSGYCKCHPRGRIMCSPLCRPGYISCQHDEDPIQLSEKVPNSHCTCGIWKCVKKTQKGECKVGGRIYKPGDKFVEPDCTGSCICHPGGVVGCASLCPPEKIQCQQNEKKVPLARSIPDSNCTCPSWKCVKDVCIVDGHIYEPGDKFVSPDCTSYSECHPGGGLTGVSLCPPEGIHCNQNEDKVQFARSIPNSNCTCPSWKCVKRPQAMPESCTSADGVVYSVGQVFADHNCRSRCHCESNGQITCQPLCPSYTDDNSCEKQKIVHLPMPVKDSAGKNCVCVVKVCEHVQVTKADEGIENDNCVMGKHIYKPGDDFVSADCSGYCKCHPKGSVSCVSLCPPEGITCQHDEDAIQLSRNIPNSNCTCPSWKCVKRKQQESGNWTRWSSWTTCNAPCGGGVRYRYRTCLDGKCFGANTETETCNLRPCNVAYSINPCGSIRVNLQLSGVWPRCDRDGFYTPLQCDPHKSQCWCVDKWGYEQPGSRLNSQKPQC